MNDPADPRADAPADAVMDMIVVDGKPLEDLSGLDSTEVVRQAGAVVAG